MRCNNTSIECWTLQWLKRVRFDESHIRIVISGMTWTLYAFNPSGRYGRLYFSELQRRNINGEPKRGIDNIIYYNSNIKESATPDTPILGCDDKSYITCRLSGRLDVSFVNWERTQIPLNQCHMTGNNFEFVSGGIKIKRHMDALVSGQLVHFNIPFIVEEWDVMITRNSDVISNAYGNIHYGLDHHTLPPKLVRLYNDDIIKLNALSGGGGTFTIIGDDVSTFLTIQEV